MGISYNPSIVTEGLVLGLDPQSTRSYVGSGTTWTDLTNRGNNGTLTNGPVFIPGGPFNNSGGSVYFDGTGGPTSTGSNLEFSSTITLGTGDFTVETWIYNTVASQRMEVWQNSSLIGAFAVSTNFNASDSMNILTRSSPPGSGWTILLRADTELQHNSWNHIAWVRSGGTLTAYLNGVADGNIISSIDSSPLLTIGGWSTGTNYMFGGYLSNLHIIKGTALYTSNFTPPTGPLEAVDDTVLLTCQGGAITDNGPSSRAITINGDAEAITASAFEFDGTNDAVTIPDNQNFEIGTASSFECWVNILTVTTDRLPFGKGSAWWFGVGYTTLGGTSGEFQWLAYDGSSWTTLNTGVTVSANTWYHLVTTWDGTYFRFYANGNLEATSSDLSAKTWNDNSSAVDIGGFLSGLQQMTNQKFSVARIYTKTLTEDEVKRNFSALRGRYGI